MLKIGLFAALAALVCYGGFLVVMFVIQRKLQYFPTFRDASQKGNDNFKPLLSGAKKFIGYFRESSTAKKTLIFFHGNGGEALDRDWLSELDPEGKLNIVLAEYPGYGGRDGRPSEKAFFEAALEIYDETAKRWNLPVTLMAESLGTGVASFLASKRTVTGLAFIAPFTSAVDIASEIYRFVPVRLLMQDKFESQKYLGGVNVPLRIIHGTLDDVVPVEFGKKLLEGYRGPKQLEEIPGYGHNNIPDAVLESPFAEGFRDLVFN